MTITNAQMAKALRVLGAVAAIVVGAYDPSGTLNTSVQTTLIALGGTILGTEHVIQGVKSVISHKSKVQVQAMKPPTEVTK